MDLDVIYNLENHPIRRRILLALWRKPSTLYELSREIGIEKASLKFHLSYLMSSKLIKKEKKYFIRKK